jgi:aldehyde dehydrogenase (NAD+)
LQLGGKNPAVVDPNCDLKTTANRLLWAKTSNAGQVCVAPDYILVPRTFQDKLIEALREAYVPISDAMFMLAHLSFLFSHGTFYPDGPAKSDSFSRIVSPRHFARIKGLLDTTKGTIVIGGETDADTKYIAPTIVKDVKGDDSLMSE